MKRALWIGAGAVAGFLGCFLAISWRIQAADGMAKMYAIGAYQLAQDLRECQQPKPLWPRRRQ